MIKFVILGFLTYSKLTGYDIKQIMTKSTSNFINASFGSIYPALNRLEKDGLISSTEVVENGKLKKVYELNKSGEEAFLKWLEEPINFMRSYEDILTKIFFYEKLPVEKSSRLIGQLIEDIRKKLMELEKLEEEIMEEAGPFQISTLYFGIEHLRFMATWYEKLLNDLNKVKRERGLNEDFNIKWFFER